MKFWLKLLVFSCRQKLARNWGNIAPNRCQMYVNSKSDINLQIPQEIFKKNWILNYNRYESEVTVFGTTTETWTFTDFKNYVAGLQVLLYLIFFVYLLLSTFKTKKIMSFSILCHFLDFVSHFRFSVTFSFLCQKFKFNCNISLKFTLFCGRI